MDLSVVVPVYNEEENLEPLIHEIRSVLDPLGKRYELILVDDGSSNNSYDLMLRLHEEDPRFKVVQLLLA